jgi:CubicO group peptidase (beta-lactamase class C family)
MRFDELTKRLARGQQSRRRLLRGLSGGLAASALAGTGLRIAGSQGATPAATPGPDLSGVAPLPLVGERLAEFESHAASTFADYGVPGASIAVVQGGEVVFLQGFGVRELGKTEPVTPDTLLRIGSVTKSFSSLLSATLVDADRLDWDTPLVDLLPAFAVADEDLTPRLTVSDAFCACTGLPRRDFEIMFNGFDLTAAQVVAGMSELPLTSAYGTTYQYNNQIVAVGGFAAALAAGGSAADLERAYAIALRERVLNPIGMPRSTFALDDVVTDGNHAHPHAEDIAGGVHPLSVLDDDYWIRAVGPSGGLWSSAREMARYVQTQLRRGVSPEGVRVVSSANLERTWQPGVPLVIPEGTPPDLAAANAHYALGWVTGSYRGQRLVQHGGATYGFGTQLAFLPDADLGVATMVNAMGAPAAALQAITFRLLELLFDQPASTDGVLETALSAAAEARADFVAQLGEVDAESVAPALGRYANPALGELALSFEDDALVFDVGENRSRLLPRLDVAGAVIEYVLVDPPLATFPPAQMVSLGEGDDGAPQVLLTVPADPGQNDTVYAFEAVTGPG